MRVAACSNLTARILVRHSISCSLGVIQSSQSTCAMEDRPKVIPGDTHSRARWTGAVLAGALSVCSIAQDTIGRPQNSLMLFWGSGSQRPVVLETDRGSFSYHAQHLFFGVEYSREINNKWRWGFQGLAMWSRFGSRWKVLVADSMDTREVGDRSWFTYRFYPFQSGSPSHAKYPTDPSVLCFTLARRLSYVRRSTFDVALSAGVLALWSTDIGYTFVATDPIHPGVDLAFGTVDFGSSIDPLVGIAIAWSRPLRSLDRVSLTFDTRLSVLNYYDYAALFLDHGNVVADVREQSRFMWFTLHAGYQFTWGPPRRPRWLRLREQRGLPAGP